MSYSNENKDAKRRESFSTAANSPRASLLSCRRDSGYRDEDSFLEKLRLVEKLSSAISSLLINYFEMTSPEADAEENSKPTKDSQQGPNTKKRSRKGSKGKPKTLTLISSATAGGKKAGKKKSPYIKAEKTCSKTFWFKMFKCLLNCFSDLAIDSYLIHSFILFKRVLTKIVQQDDETQQPRSSVYLFRVFVACFSLSIKLCDDDLYLSEFDFVKGFSMTNQELFEAELNLLFNFFKPGLGQDLFVSDGDFEFESDSILYLY